MNDNRQGTALITGASSGIGEAFAKELASQNYDLVIIARRKDRLLELARELKSNYSISVDVIAADLSTEEGIERVEEYIKKAKNLDILINNAGFGTKGNFSDVPPEKSINMINLHVLKVIDIGCGAGWLTRNLAKKVPEGEVVGIDSSEDYIKKLNQSLEKDKSGEYKNLVFRLANAENIPSPDSYFNYAVSFVSLSFWDEPEKVLKEISRVLKLDGKLCIADMYKEGSFWTTGLGKIFSRFSPYKTNIYSSQEFREFFQIAGFTEVYQKEIMGMLVTMGTNGYK